MSPSSFDAREPIVAKVLLKDSELPRAKAILDAWRRDAEGYPPISNVEVTGSGISFTILDETVGIALSPVPVSAAELDFACRTSAFWPEAADALKGHRAHLVVASNGAGDLRLRHLVATKVIAAVAQASNAAGIYWVLGAAIHSPELFIQTSREATPDALPIPLWIGFCLTTEAPGTSTLATIGMPMFGHRDIEVRRSKLDPGEVFDAVLGCARYQIEKASALEDGSTVEFGEKASIRVRVSPSLWEKRGPVTVLEM